jgi:short-subunit dehydrogenase
LTARRQERLEQLQQQLSEQGVEVRCLSGDITRESTRERLVDQVRQHWQGLDVLINNAGVGAIGPFARADPQRLRQIMEVNFFAPAELTRQALPLLRRGRSPILANIGSVLGSVAVPGKSEYCASKFALHGLSDALYCELKREGIDVLLVNPNTTRSEFFDHLIRRDGKVAANPLSSSPEAVARRIVVALRRGRAELTLTLSGRALIWLDRLCPWLSRRVLTRWG